MSIEGAAKSLSHPTSARENCLFWLGPDGSPSFAVLDVEPVVFHVEPVMIPGSVCPARAQLVDTPNVLLAHALPLQKPGLIKGCRSRAREMSG